MNERDPIPVELSDEVWEEPTKPGFSLERIKDSIVRNPKQVIGGAALVGVLSGGFIAVVNGGSSERDPTIVTQPSPEPEQPIESPAPEEEPEQPTDTPTQEESPDRDGKPALPEGYEDYKKLDVSAGGEFRLDPGVDYQIVGQHAADYVYIRGEDNNVVVKGLDVTIPKDNPDEWKKLGEHETTALGFDIASTTDEPVNVDVHGLVGGGDGMTQFVRAKGAIDLTLVDSATKDPVTHGGLDHLNGTNGAKKNHPDIVQVFKNEKGQSPNSVVIDGLDGASAYQGLFFNGSDAELAGGIEISNASLKATELQDGEDYFAGQHMLRVIGDIDVKTDNVWIDGSTLNGWRPPADGEEGGYKASQPYGPDDEKATGEDYMAVAIGGDAAHAYEHSVRGEDERGKYAEYPTHDGSKVRVYFLDDSHNPEDGLILDASEIEQRYFGGEASSEEGGEDSGDQKDKSDDRQDDEKADDKKDDDASDNSKDEPTTEPNE